MKMLPIVSYEGTQFFFDERLKQIRKVINPHNFQDLNDFEMVFFRELVNGGYTFAVCSICSKVVKGKDYSFENNKCKRCC